MILGIAPDFDEASKHSHQWFNDLMDSLEGNKATLEKDEAVREKVESSFRKLDPELIVFYDHGSEDGLVAQGGDGYVIDMKNIDTFKGKTIYTMACLSAAVLGKEHWRNGGVYWGYTEPFGFTIQEENLFKRCANAGLLHRQDNHTWIESLEHAREVFKQAKKEAQLTWTKVWLQHDRDCLECYTPDNPPESKCTFRRNLFKLTGWRSKPEIGGPLLMGFGLGVLVHDYAHELYLVGGYPEILSPQGGWIGLLVFLVGFMLKERGIHLSRISPKLN